MALLGLAVSACVCWLHLEGHPDFIATLECDPQFDAVKVARATFLDLTINGSYKIYTKSMMTKFNPMNHGKIEDNCTNIHYQIDLEQAKKALWLSKI